MLINFPQDQFDGQLFLAWAGGVKVINRTRAAAYAAVLRHAKGHQVQLWGYGGIKNTETIPAYAISHAIEEILAHITSDDFRMEVVAEKIGFNERLELVPSWVANGNRTAAGKTPAEHEPLRQSYLSMQQGQIVPPRFPSPDEIAMWIGPAATEAKRIAQVAESKGAGRSEAFETRGIGWSTCVS